MATKVQIIFEIANLFGINCLRFIFLHTAGEQKSLSVKSPKPLVVSGIFFIVSQR